MAIDPEKEKKAYQLSYKQGGEKIDAKLQPVVDAFVTGLTKAGLTTAEAEQVAQSSAEAARNLLRRRLADALRAAVRADREADRKAAKK